MPAWILLQYNKLLEYKIEYYLLSIEGIVVIADDIYLIKSNYYAYQHQFGSFF